MSNDSLDRVVQLNGLSLAAVIDLIDRLEQTQTSHHYLCREAELDDAYRHADADLKLAELEGSSPDRLRELVRMRDYVILAHDLVGERNAAAAVQELNRVVEMKIGLDGDGASEAH